MKKLSLLLLLTSLFIFGTGSSFAQDSLKIGDKAPNFTLTDVYGNVYTLSKIYKKEPVVIYFYPKAGTPGCTKQACGIRDDWSKFKKHNIQVLGISVDSKQAIRKFIKDYKLNFPLLSDSSKSVSGKYGVLQNNGVDNRVTFIVDRKGKIVDIFKVTDISAHAEKVFKIASKL